MFHSRLVHPCAVQTPFDPDKINNPGIKGNKKAAPNIPSDDKDERNDEERPVFAKDLQLYKGIVGKMGEHGDEKALKNDAIALHAFGSPYVLGKKVKEGHVEADSLFKVTAEVMPEPFIFALFIDKGLKVRFGEIETKKSREERVGKHGSKGSDGKNSEEISRILKGIDGSVKVITIFSKGKTDPNQGTIDNTVDNLIKIPFILFDHHQESNGFDAFLDHRDED